MHIGYRNSGYDQFLSFMERYEQEGSKVKKSKAFNPYKYHKVFKNKKKIKEKKNES